MGAYPSNHFYTQMFVDAGFPEAAELKAWSDAMIDAVMVWGNEAQVKEKLNGLFKLGASEILASPVLVREDRSAAMARTLRVLAEASEGAG